MPNKENAVTTIWMPTILLIILLIAFYLRYQSVWFSYPLITHPDEPTVLNNALRMLKNKDANPHFFNYPSFLLYLTACLAFLMGFINDLWVGTGLIGVERINILVAGRLVASTAAVASLIAVFLAGKRMLHPAVGLMAAAMLAVSHLHVHNSALVTTDIWVAVFASFAALQCLCILQEQRWRNYLLAGMMVGLAAGSKYTAITLSLGIFLAHMSAHPLRFSRIWDVKLWAAAVVCIMSFLATTPYALLDKSAFLRAVAFESRHYRRGHPGAEAAGDTSWHLYADALFSNSGIGLISAFLVIIGLYWAVKNRNSPTLVIFSMPLILFIFVGNYKVFFDRNIVGALPTLALVASVGLFVIYNSLCRIRSLKLIPFAVAGILVAITLAPIATESLRAANEKMLKDTNLVLIDWMERELPQGSSVIIGGVSSGIQAYLPQLRFENSRQAKIRDGSALRFDPDIEYIVMGSRLFGRFFDSEGNPKPMYKARAEAYLEFFSSHELIHEIIPQSGLTSGPSIKIFANKISTPDPKSVTQMPRRP